MRVDRRVWRSAVFGLPIVAFLAIFFDSRHFYEAVFTSSTSTRQKQPIAERVTIWSPPPCNGSFVSEPAAHSTDGAPYAMIREAVIDRRPLSHRQYREVYRTNAFQRIILYLSTHLSVVPTHDNAKVTLVTTDNLPVPGVIIRMDYALRVDPFLFQGPYQPGNLTKQSHQVSECQVAISLAPTEQMSQPDFEEHIQAISSDGAKVHIELLLRRFDGAEITFKPSFDLSCATAWERPDIFPLLDRLQQPACHTNVTNTTGAVVLSGSALYGMKKTTPSYYAEVAHFGARAMSGPIKFDTVAMGVVVNNSVSDRQLCGNETCVANMNMKNEQLLESVREVVEAELDAIGFDQSLRPNLLLVPLCRLGSDASNTELADPCQLSHRYGQYHATFFTYAMLAPYFKWAASYDMDEFFAMNPQNGSFRSASADAMLDEVNKDGSSNMVFTWLGFEVDPNSSRSLSRDILDGKALDLRIKENKEDVDCLRFTEDPTGKSAVRCDVGVGFTIHRPVIRKYGEALGTLGQTQGKVRSTELRTWHARLGGSKGACFYVERNETPPAA